MTCENKYRRVGVHVCSLSLCTILLRPIDWSNQMNRFKEIEAKIMKQENSFNTVILDDDEAVYLRVTLKRAIEVLEIASENLSKILRSRDEVESQLHAFNALQETREFLKQVQDE